MEPKPASARARWLAFWITQSARGTAHVGIKNPRGMPGIAYYAYSPLRYFEPFADPVAAQTRQLQLQAQHPPQMPFFVARFYTFEAGERVVFRKRSAQRKKDETGTVVGLAKNGFYSIRCDIDKAVEEVSPPFLEPEEFPRRAVRIVAKIEVYCERSTRGDISIDIRDHPCKREEWTRSWPIDRFESSCMHGSPLRFSLTPLVYAIGVGRDSVDLHGSGHCCTLEQRNSIYPITGYATVSVEYADGFSLRVLFLFVTPLVGRAYLPHRLSGASRWCSSSNCARWPI